MGRPRLLITGASGFIGRALIDRLTTQDIYAVNASVRSKSRIFPNDIRVFEGKLLDSKTSWGDALESVHTVIHTAARVHVMKEHLKDPYTRFHEVNVEGTLNLVAQASERGVKRFIFLSSVKVNGESTPIGKPFKEKDLPNPQDPYAVSKREAEERLTCTARETGIEVVIIRLPLVYGPSVKGNFLTILKMLRRGLPIPLGNVQKKRSMVYIENVTDFIMLCVEHPLAKGEVFLISDGEDVSMTELVMEINDLMGRPSWIFSVPEVILRCAFTIAGKTKESSRVLRSLQVDITKAQNLLDWRPPISLETGLERTVRGYLLDDSETPL